MTVQAVFEDWRKRLKHRAGQHNQKRHGWRTGTLEAVRRALRAGVSPDYATQTTPEAERAAYRKRAGLPEPKKIDKTPVKESIDAALERMSQANKNDLWNPQSTPAKLAAKVFHNAPEGTRVVLEDGRLGTLRWRNIGTGKVINIHRVQYDKPDKNGRTESYDNNPPLHKFDALDPKVSWLNERNWPRPVQNPKARILRNTDTYTVSNALQAFQKAGGAKIFGVLGDGTKVQLTSAVHDYWRGQRRVTFFGNEPGVAGTPKAYSLDRFEWVEVGE